jgi:hypothetical protein
MVELDELANARTLARVLTVLDKATMGKNTLSVKDHLSKYTKGPMPEI